MKKYPLLLVLVGLASSMSARAVERFPWKFGMSPHEVEAVTAYGPYKTFNNGDLETYNGVLDGRKQDFQFFFKDGKLVRIGIDLHEGRDLEAAIGEWAKLYKLMFKTFGQIETPDTAPPVGDDATQFMAAARQIVESTGKTQMAPIKQPEDSFVFASLLRYEVQGRISYIVFLYFNPPHV